MKRSGKSETPNTPDLARASGGDGRQRVFVGDVQGCDDELGDLLDALRFDPAAQALWFVGDLVNRGPASLRALRRIRAVAAGVVLGNHDLHLLGLAWKLRKAKPGDTLDELLAASDREELVDWLRLQPVLHCWDDLTVVHAGLHPSWSNPSKLARRLEARIQRGAIPFDDLDLQFLTRVRHCTATGARPKNDRNPGPGYAPWYELYTGKRRVVFGHWAERGLVKTKKVRGLDSGCVWGGHLTAWLADEDRFVSVPARRVYRELSR